MSHRMFKLSMITMFIIVMLFSVELVNEKLTTPLENSKIVSTKEQKVDDGVVLAANKKTDKHIVDFSWIEKGLDGQLDDIEFRIGTNKDEILSKRGTAIDTGYYEGGQFFRYDDATFFINPETNQLVAIALSTEDEDLDASKLKKALGTPDVSERNEMEDLWMYEYYLDQYSLMFEADEENGNILFAWLKKRL
ncbi:DUF4309 domain-containing protein [Alkalihalobacterium alkalinitrilicum]|uniref:DUF4309 domain-containing protein n=1 Tax=Alkalihalobacterium alkalinitrilicum TaxID=427920 RepID=UPI0009953CF5|nr:DUF4309 domain-containing protein [Alkalihalobacterium alkalinitrilicum]